MIKGIILAGGLGSRLYPLTKVTNKHLLPVYHKPMIYYPIQTLVKAGIRDVLLVTGGTSAGDFLRLIGNGRRLGLRHIHYVYQEGEGGIAQALSMAEYFADGKKIVVILGDNLIEDDIRSFVVEFERQPAGARIFLKKVKDAQRFGVPAFNRKKEIVKISEKPKKPASNFAVTGLYMYDAQVFDMIKELKPSRRGELEISDINNRYLRKGQLEYNILRGSWTDAGTFSSLLRANQLAAAKRLP